MNSPERTTFLNGLFEGLDDRNSIRLFQAFAKFREIPLPQRTAIAQRCCALMHQQKKKAQEETAKYQKLAPQLQKARNEIRVFLGEPESPSYDPITQGIQVFRKLSVLEKHEAAGTLQFFGWLPHISAMES